MREATGLSPHLGIHGCGPWGWAAPKGFSLLLLRTCLSYPRTGFGHRIREMGQWLHVGEKTPENHLMKSYH